MPVIRQKHTRDFTNLPNALLQDQRLSCRDRGLLVWMLSKPPDWEFSKLSIVDELKLDGESSIKSGIKNLKAAGYLEIRQERIKGKVSRSVWTVTDTPQGCFNPTGSPQGRYPPMENSPYTKERINKRNKAAPALEGGAQLPEDIFFDQESGEFRRKGSA